MDRRSLLTGAAAGSAFGLVSAPAIAKAQPQLNWRLTSSFPKTLDVLYGGTEMFARRVAQLTEGNFKIQLFAPGEIVGGLQALDAVSSGTVEMCHTASYYFTGKSPAFAFGSAIPFGLNARQHNTWMYNGGGMEKLNKFYNKYHVHGIPLGSTGAQMGGWFRREVNKVDDLRGLKFRVGGMGGTVLEKLGVVPQQLAPGDIYPSLERGTLDAVEFIGPHDDEKLGFVKVAKYYYYPGFWDANVGTHAFVSLKAWEELPPLYKAAVEVAAAEANQWMLARYDGMNPAALRRLVSAGAELRAFPKDILEAAYSTATKLYQEISATNPDFKELYDDLIRVRNDTSLWFRVCELPLDIFIGNQSRA